MLGINLSDAIVPKKHGGFLSTKTVNRLNAAGANRYYEVLGLCDDYLLAAMRHTGFERSVSREVEEFFTERGLKMPESPEAWLQAVRTAGEQLSETERSLPVKDLLADAGVTNIPHHWRKARVSDYLRATQEPRHFRTHVDRTAHPIGARNLGHICLDKPGRAIGAWIIIRAHHLLA